MPSIRVEVDLDEFSDDDLLHEVEMRALGSPASPKASTSMHR